MDGAKVALRLTFGNRRGCLFSVEVPDFKHPIWMRGRTSDVATFAQVFAQAEYDISSTAQGRALREQYDALVASGDRPLIIDCGANIGLSCVWFANHFPMARIVGVEPDLGNNTVASKNLSEYSNVELRHGAIWDVDSSLDIVNPDGKPWAYRVEQTTEPSKRTVPGFTITGLSNGGPIFIVKIDIEGAEKFLFRSNMEWINKTTLIAIELHDWLFPRAGTSHNFLQAIARQRCDILIKGENLFFLMSEDT